MSQTTRVGIRSSVTEQSAPYPRGPLGENPANKQTLSAAPDEPSTYEKEAARIAEVKRVAARRGGGSP